MEYVLGHIWWALCHEFVAPKTLILEWLDKSKEGQWGAVHTAIAKSDIFDRVYEWVKGMANDTATSADHVKEVATVLEKCFADWQVFTAAFPQEAGSSDESPRVASQGNDCAHDPVAVKKSEYNSTLCHVVIDFFYDLMSGSYDKIISNTIQSYLQTQGKDNNKRAEHSLERCQGVGRIARDFPHPEPASEHDRCVGN